MSLPLELHQYSRGISTAEPVENSQLGTFIDNWIRLGLVEVNYGDYLNREAANDWMAGRPEVAETGASSTRTAVTVDFDKGCIRPTDFLRIFR